MIIPKISKRGQNQLWWIMVAAAIAIIVGIIIIMIFKNGGDKGSQAINKQLEGLQDTDNDGVADRYDQCQNTPAAQTVDEKGCSPAQAAALT